MYDVRMSGRITEEGPPQHVISSYGVSLYECDYSLLVIKK
jgi:hypothetical protein